MIEDKIPYHHTHPSPEQPVDPPSPTADKVRVRKWADRERERWGALSNALESLTTAQEYLTEGQEGGPVIEVPVKGRRDQDADILMVSLIKAVTEEMAMIVEDLLDAGCEPPEVAKATEAGEKG